MVVDGGRVRFEEFVAHRLTSLYRYALVLAGNQHDAEDLVQEALSRVAAAWHRVRADDPESYVRTTMARIMFNQWRRPRREHLMADVPDQPVEERGFMRLTQAEDLDAALASLPSGMRTVLVLRYIDQLTDAEIANALGCTRGTVKSQASRGLAKLRAQLAALGSDDG